MEHKYVIVKDSKGCRNVWELKDCFNVNGEDTYEIHSRTTTAFVEKDLCVNKQGSSLFHYNSDRTIDINDSNIEIEKWSDYEAYLLNNIYVEDVK